MVLGRDIRDLVIAKLEEYSPFMVSMGEGIVASPRSESILSGNDKIEEVKPIYSYVDDFMSEAANEILSVIPLHIAPVFASASIAKADSDDKATGYISLPLHYLRLHTLVMYGWSCPVHHVTLANEPLYAQQFNKWQRGTCQKPVVIYHINQMSARRDTLYKTAAQSLIRDTDMAQEITEYNDIISDNTQEGN